MDFNAILEKANRNSQNAQKILKIRHEEKKKVIPQRAQSNGNVKSTTADEAFSRKKIEDERIRVQREAKEFLEKKRKNLVNNNEDKSKALKKPMVEQKPAHTNPSAVKKPYQLSQTQNKAANLSSNSSKPSVPKTTTTQTVKKVTGNQNTLSYSDILKLADKLQESAKNPKQPQQPNRQPNQSPVIFKRPADVAKPKPPVKTNNESSQKTNSSKFQQHHPPPMDMNKRFLPGDIRNKSLSSSNESLRIDRSHGSKNNITQASTKSTGSIKTNPKSNLTVNKNIAIKSSNSTVQKTGGAAASVTSYAASSSWDRITSDIKKKKPAKVNSSKSVQKIQSNDDYYDLDDDDEEYDSDMEDFIDEGEDDDDDAGDSYSEEIRKLFKYDPKRYKDMDDKDLANMESSYHDIEREERKSAKIGYLEDLEDMRLEDEEKKKKFTQSKRQRTC